MDPYLYAHKFSYIFVPSVPRELFYNNLYFWHSGLRLLRQFRKQAQFVNVLDLAGMELTLSTAAHVVPALHL